MSVMLWSARLDRPLTAGEMEQLLKHLPPQRKEKLLRISDRERWREPLCAYALLGLALKKTYGWSELPEVGFGELGKPYFPSRPEVQFSISHTDGAVLVGLSDRPIGVDIEEIQPVTERVRQRLAGENCTLARYYSRWVCYEASVKRRGAGVTPHHEAWEEQDAVQVELYPGYASAISGEGEPVIRKVTLDDLLDS